jgi:hypothetical protein
MTNWYKIFYWLTVADNFKDFFIVWIVLFMIISVVSTILWIVGRSSEDLMDTKVGANAAKWMKWSIPFCILFWTLFLMTPSKSDTLLIIAGGAVGNFVTSDSSSRAIPSEITQFLHMKLQGEIAGASNDIKAQLGVQSPKEKLMDKVKSMTKEQLIEYLQSDTTIAH